MNITLLFWIVEIASSSHVVSSGQYKINVCSSSVDVNVRMIYNPDLKVGSTPLSVWPPCRTSDPRALCIQRKLLVTYSKKIDMHVDIYGTQFAKEPHDFSLRAIYTDGLEYQIVQDLEVDLRDRRISAWGERVDKCLERPLGNHDLIDCRGVVSVYSTNSHSDALTKVVPGPLFCDQIEKAVHALDRTT